MPIDIRWSDSAWLAPMALAAQLRARSGEAIGRGLSDLGAGIGDAAQHTQDQQRAERLLKDEQRIQESQFSRNFGLRQQEHQDVLDQNEFQNDVTKAHFFDAEKKRLAQQAAGLQQVPGFDQTPEWGQLKADLEKLRANSGAVEARILGHGLRKAAAGGPPGTFDTQTTVTAPGADQTFGGINGLPYQDQQAARDRLYGTPNGGYTAPAAPVAPAAPMGAQVAPAAAPAAGPDTAGMDDQQAALVKQHAGLLADTLAHQRMVESIKMIAQGGGVAPVPLVKEETRMAQDLAIRGAAIAARDRNYTEERIIGKARQQAENIRKDANHEELMVTLGALQDHSPELVDLMHERLAKGLDDEESMLGKSKRMLANITKDEEAKRTEDRQTKMRGIEQTNRLAVAEVHRKNQMAAQQNRYNIYHRFPDMVDPIKLQDVTISALRHNREMLMDRLDTRKFMPKEDADQEIARRSDVEEKVTAIESQIAATEAEKYRLMAIPKEQLPSTRTYLRDIPGENGRVGQDEGAEPSFFGRAAQSMRSFPGRATAASGKTAAYPSWVQSHMRAKWDALTDEQKDEAVNLQMARRGG